MKNKTTVWIIIAAALIVAGGLIFTLAMASNGWDFRTLSTAEYETATYDISEDFEDILIETDCSDVILLPSEDGETRVVCRYDVKMKNTACVKDGVLEIRTEDIRKWYDHIQIFSFGAKESIKVYLPDSEYENLTIEGDTSDVEISEEFSFEAVKISVSTGDIAVEGILAGSLEAVASTGDITVSDVTCKGSVEINVTTGDIQLENVTCGSLRSKGDTGDASFDGVLAAESISVKRSTGDVKLWDCDAETLNIKTSTGDVEGRLLTSKIFVVDTSTGDVSVPSTDSGGRCEISTSTGDIKIELG